MSAASSDPFTVYDDADIDRARITLGRVSEHLNRGLGDPQLLLISAELALKDLLRITEHRADLGRGVVSAAHDEAGG